MFQKKQIAKLQDRDRLMGSLQLQSQKIKKRSKNNLDEPQNFVCGECHKAYKFYPGLYLHVKNKHDGVRPPGTKVVRPTRAALDLTTRPGRPKKREKDIDYLDDTEAGIEASHNELMRFLGERVMATYSLSSKVSLEAITKKVLETSEKSDDEWITAIGEESQAFLAEYKERDRKMQNLDFDEEFIHLDKNKSLRIIVWFMMWLAKIHVKSEFIPDLCIIASRMLKIVRETDLEAQDLDNKLVWKKVASSCELLLPSLPMFRGDSTLLVEFIRQSCQLIGKVFEDKTV